MQFVKKSKLVSWLFDEMPDTPKENNKTITMLPIHTITPNPYQPRRNFDLESLEELSQSIKKFGVLQPVTVRRLYSGNYELIAGERRLRACSMAGMLKIPAIVVDMNDKDCAVVAIVENIQRENLDFMEEAEAYRSLLYYHGLTQEDLSAALGKSQSFIANKVRLLKLSKAVRSIVADHRLSERHARALLRVENEQKQLEILEEICSKNLNVRQSEELIDSVIESGRKNVTRLPVRRFKGGKQNDMKLFANTLRHAVDLMQRRGIETVSTRTEFEDRIEYLISVQKNKSDSGAASEVNYS